jgi:hypothetical protein
MATADLTSDNWRWPLRRAARGLPCGTCRFTHAVADAPLIAGTGTSANPSRYVPFVPQWNGPYAHLLTRQPELMRVSVIGTVHESSGLANAKSLQVILTRLEPSVIFAEIPSTHLDEYVDGSHGTLESIAVRDYRESYEAAVVPVDLPKPDEAFFADAKSLFDTVERTSYDYRCLMDQHSADTRAGGFPYLNSSRCIQAWADIYRELQATVEWIGDPRLREIYQRWVRVNDRRDSEMMRTIEEYCVANVFGHGVLLVGATHRGPIADKARIANRTAAERIEWVIDELDAGWSNQK